MRPPAPSCSRSSRCSGAFAGARGRCAGYSPAACRASSCPPWPPCTGFSSGMAAPATGALLGAAFTNGRPDAPLDQPNAIWTADFKGQFRTGNGIYCYPLTVQDAATRFLLGCRGLLEPTIDASWPVFQRLFRRYGLPERIRTDNGAPFASCALGRLSTLSVWWIRLGIHPELIEPAHPEQNGRHERMHKTLKAETARPPRRTLAAQQRRFDWFRDR